MRFCINQEKVMFTQVGNDGVLYGIEKGEYLSLNETFVEIFKGIQEGKTQEEIVDYLLSVYAIDQQSCEVAVKSCVNQLVEKEFITCLDA